MKINELSRNVKFLYEGKPTINIVNGGKDDVSIKDADGNEVARIHSFEKIFSYFIREIVDTRTTPDVVKWFNSNFKKWIKTGAKDQQNLMMDDDKFQATFYVPLTEYIQFVLQSEPDLVAQGKLSQEIIIQSLPSFARNSLNDAVVFSGGRIFRLKKILPAVGRLKDYLNAVEANKQNRNDQIMPPTFMLNRLDTLQVPEAFRRCDAWHNYVAAQAEKVSYAQALQLVQSLKPNVDFKVLDKIGNVTFVQLLTSNMAKIEGDIMKHCVASYGHDIETGKSIIYSARDENGVPVATMEINGKNMTQLQGPHDSTINPKYQNDIRKFIKKHNFNVTSSGDVKKVGGLDIRDE